MLNNVVFTTGGDWDSTTLYANGEEVSASQLLVQFSVGRDEDGNEVQGGVSLGGSATGIVRTQDGEETPIFPGRLEMKFPKHVVSVSNEHPAFQFEATRVSLDGADVSNHLVDLQVNIDAEKNEVQAYITLYKAHWLGSDEVATYTLL